MRYALRSAYLTWEFWILPVLALLSIGSLVWLMSHNQDLLRERQIDKAALNQMDTVKSQVQSLHTEIQGLRSVIEANSHKVDQAVDIANKNQRDLAKTRQEVGIPK